MSTALMAAKAAVANETLTEEQKAQLLAAAQTHDQVIELRAKVAAFDWKSILTAILPFLTTFIPGIGPIITLILQILNVLPNVIPNGGIPDPN